MKRKLLAVLAALGLFSLMAFPALAAIESGEQYAFIADDEVIDDDLFIAAQEVVIEGTVNGDVFAAGGKVTVSGTINGDLYVAAGVLDVTGTVSQDIVGVAETITLDAAQVGDGVVMAGADISLDKDSTIGGGLLYGASNMNLNAAIGRGVMGASAVTRVDGTVGKNMRLATEQFTLSSNGMIQGDLNVIAQEGTEVNEAQVQGQVELVEKSNPAEESERDMFAFHFTKELFSYLGALIVGLLLIAFIPRLYHQTGKEMMARPLMAFAYGLMFFIGVPFLAVLSMITLVGVPLGLLLFAKYFALLYMGKIFVAAIMTAALLRWTKAKWLKDGNEYFVFMLILALFFVLKNLPYVGVFLNGFALIMAWGSVSMAGLAILQSLKKEK